MGEWYWGSGTGGGALGEGYWGGVLLEGYWGEGFGGRGTREGYCWMSTALGDEYWGSGEEYRPSDMICSRH